MLAQWELAALADHCYQSKVELSLRRGLERTIITFKACLLVHFKQTWQQTVKMFAISCIRELS